MIPMGPAIHALEVGIMITMIMTIKLEMVSWVCSDKPLNICKVFIVFVYIVMFYWSFNYNILLILIFMIDIS